MSNSPTPLRWREDVTSEQWAAALRTPGGQVVVRELDAMLRAMCERQIALGTVFQIEAGKVSETPHQ